MFQVTSRVQPDHLFNLSDNRRSLSSDLYMGGDRGAAGEIANQDSVAVHTESQQASSGSMLSSLKAAIYLCGFCSSPVHPEGSKEARFKEIAFLVKQLFANFAYNINGDIVERSFCLIGQIKLTVCFDSIIQLSKYFSSTHKARCLFARFCYTESIPLVKDDALSRDYECKTTLLLQDFSAALSLSRLSRLEAHNNDYFEEVKKASTSFSHELKSKTEGLLEANSEAVLLSSEVKALLLRLAKESQQRSLEYLQLSISANAQKLTSDNSFIYYVAIRHSKFFQESFDSKHGCGEGFVHVFALEQYLDNEQNEAFRLYNSYKGKYTLDSWLEDKRRSHFNKGRIIELFTYLRSLLQAEKWTAELREGWRNFFNVQVSAFSLYSWKACNFEDIKTGLIDEEDISISLKLQGLTVRFAYDNFKPSEVALKLKKSTKPL